MKISTRLHSDIQIFEIQGEINFHSSPELRKALAASLQEKRAALLVCMKKVTYIDSSGLATFVEALQKVKRYNGRLVLASLVPAVRGVFEIAKLDGIFTLARNREDALQMLQP